MKKIALLYAWKSTQGGITSFYKDILWSFDSTKYEFHIFTATEKMPLDVFSHTETINTPEWLLNFIFKFNLHIPYSSLVMLLFYRKLKKYDQVIINQELSFPLWIFLKNDITILHGSTLMAMHSWIKEKKYFYALYYFIVSFNTVLTYLVASKVYTVSEFTKNYISKFNNNVEVCWLWVDQNFWKLEKHVKKIDFWFKESDFLLIFVWRFDIWKWSDKVISIMDSLSKKNKDIKMLACVSKLPENYKEYEKIWIQFFKNLWKEDLKKLYSISDTFFFPTRYEWYWLVLAEALSVWLPVVTSNIALWNLLKCSKSKDSSIGNQVQILESEDIAKQYEDAVLNNYKRFLKGELLKYRLNLNYLNLQNAIDKWVTIFK